MMRWRPIFLLLLACALLAAQSCNRKPDVISLEAESMDGVSARADYGEAAGWGWGSYAEQSFSNGRAILTKFLRAEAKGRVAGLTPGRSYLVEVLVYHYGGPERNALELSVGGVTKKLTFGGPKTVPGLVRMTNLYFEHVQSDEVIVRSLEIGQIYLVVDRIRFIPHDRPVAFKTSVWEKEIPMLQGEECFNCVQAEGLEPVKHEANYGEASGWGWASYPQESYSAGRAALTRLPGSTMSGRIPNFQPGAYRITIGVASQDEQANELDVQVGETARRIRFGPGLTAGVTTLSGIVFENVAVDTLALRAHSIGQPYLIVDALSLEPLDDLPPAQAHTEWSSTEVEPIQDICVNCIEAEGMAGVSGDPNYGVSARTGWASYEQAAFSAGRAALTATPGASMEAAIPEFRAGAYEVQVTVFSYGGAANTLDVILGGQVRKLTFTKESGSGVVRLPAVRVDGVQSATVRIQAVQIGQPYLVVDTVSLRPVR